MPAINVKNLTHTISVKDVYNTSSPKPPEGYEFTGEFRAPVNGDMILAAPPYSWGDAVRWNHGEGDPRHPVLILRKQQKEYTDKEVLDFILHWLQRDVAYNAITSAASLKEKGPWNVYRQLISSSFGDGDEPLKKAIEEEMRLQGV